jgi:ABC-type nickel/cobalt efflux system permease component RcnA
VVFAGSEAFGLGVLISAFLFGFRHGIDWDHIAAITDITGSQDDRRTALLFGSLYALGHGVVVFVIGCFAIVLGERLPSGIDNLMERIVGVTLIILGVFVFVSLIRHGREFRMRSRWMLIFSGVRSVYRRLRSDRSDPGADDAHDEEPVHVHSGDGSVALAVAEDLPASEWHHGHHGRPGHHHHKHPEPDAFMNYGKRTAFVVGMIHGIGAETPTQVVIFFAAAGSPGGKTTGVIVLLAFLLGLFSSNTMITLGSSFGFLRASQNWKIYVTVAVLTGTFSLIIGTLFILGRGSALPVLFGG